MHAHMPGFSKLERLPFDKQHISKHPRNSHMSIQDTDLVPSQSTTTITLKVADWRTWAYTDGSCLVHNGKQEIGAGVYCPSTDSKIFVEPNGAGITKTITRAELAAIAAAIITKYADIASDSLTSLNQIRKQLLYPERHLRHIQGDVLKMVSTLIRDFHTKIRIYKVKSHAGIAGNECADAIAKHQAKQAQNCVADTEIPGAGPGGNPFTNIFWLAKEERVHAAGTPTGPPPAPMLTYFPNLQDALKSHMHSKHKLGYANAQTGYYSYYQNLLPQVDKKISNAFRNMPNISVPMKRTILQYRTGTLYNQKTCSTF
jgi:ribonuclease HI